MLFFLANIVRSHPISLLHHSRFLGHSAIGFDDLSPELQKEVNELRNRMAIELQPLVLESTLTMQKILEADDHTARLQLLRHFVEGETRRLSTKKALKGMVQGTTTSSSSSSADVPPEEQIDESAEDTVAKRAAERKPSESSSTSTPPSPPSSGSTPSSIFPDEPDAFQ